MTQIHAFFSGGSVARYMEIVGSIILKTPTRHIKDGEVEKVVFESKYFRCSYWRLCFKIGLINLFSLVKWMWIIYSVRVKWECSKLLELTIVYFLACIDSSTSKTFQNLETWNGQKLSFIPNYLERIWLFWF